MISDTKIPLPLDPQKIRTATRFAFIAAGFGLSCWAPLVPFAKARLGVGEATLGLLLLCVGAGSVITMPLVGALSTRVGSKPIILAGGVGIALMLPLLAVLRSSPAIAAALLVFGASVGSLDVAMNTQAVEVERLSARPLISGFHALFSLGGFAGSGFITLLLSRHVSPVVGALTGSAVVITFILSAAPSLLKAKGENSGSAFVLPRGIILLLGLLACISFLVEGSMLDWSALLLITSKLVSATRGGVGYMLFSIAMTTGRFYGDRVVAAMGERRVLLAGGLTAIAGLVLIAVSPYAALALAGFVLIGLGSANTVPILFRRAGNQPFMPTGLALAAVTTAGYAGLLAGPALIGFMAHGIGLRNAFLVLAVLLTLIPALNKKVTAGEAQGHPLRTS